ncbi:MAG: hypothetical protein J3K34DRAFT_483100 [Monoraphidium minutum]|nr:MAG: hypothetical protein J3K34DRAFT_483100 [Monoraphidium minutum]
MGGVPHDALRRALALLLAWLTWPLTLLIAAASRLRAAIGAGSGDAAAPRSAAASPVAAFSARRHPKSKPLLDLPSPDGDAATDFGSSGAGDDDSAYGRDQGEGRRFEFIGADDLAWFLRRIAPAERAALGGGAAGVDGWSLMMDKHVPGEVKYTSYMRPLPNGTTEYLSATVAPNTTAAEMAEFFADDAERLKWDSMLHRTQLVEPGRNLQRQAEQIILWHRKYPFAFLKDRWYCIARKLFTPPPGSGGSAPHYGVSRVVHSPVAEAYAADEMPGVKRIDEFYSMWACHTVPSPWPAADGGAPEPACLTLLLHHDNMRVPESLARVAIRTGMWKFLRAMVAAMRPWVAARRARAAPFEDDADAVCRRPTGGADGRQPPLSAIYGHDGTAAPVPLPGGAGGPPPGWAPHRHDAAALHAVATAPGDLQHMAAAAAAADARRARAAARAAAAAEAEAEDAALAARWPRDGSSASSLSSADSCAGGAGGLNGWMGWLPRARRPPPRPAAPAPPAAPEVAAPQTPPRGAARPPPSEAPAPAAREGGAAPAPRTVQLPTVLSDPGLYRPGKTCEEGTQTWLLGGGGAAASSLTLRAGAGTGRRPGAAGGLARSVAAGALAGMAVLLLARVAEADPAAPLPHRRRGGGGSADAEQDAASADAEAAPERLGPWREGRQDVRRRTGAALRRVYEL